MSTQNATITTSWTKLADAADSSVLVQAAGYVEYQIAATATDVAPTVAGHTIAGRDAAVSRALIGPGHLYARLTAGGESATLVVTGSSESLS